MVVWPRQMVEWSMPEKQCSRCRQTKPLSEFHRNAKSSDGHKYECKRCRLGLDDPERRAALMNRSRELEDMYRANSEYQADRNARFRDSHARRRRTVIDNLGGKCVCCGETEIVFLTVDHIEGGGNDHRRQLGGSSQNLYRWLIKKGFPDGFQVLCFNCNQGKHVNGGVCPHQIPCD
jgi:hypothetical protein